LLPFLLAGLAIAHLIALHVHGSNNPNGISANVDRYPMHPYFTFKDLVTIFLFLLVLSIMVFYYPNNLGQMWPNTMLIFYYINIVFVCAISWKYILKLNLVKIYSKTIFVSELFYDNILIWFNISNLNINLITFYLSIGLVPKLRLISKNNPNIVRYYYKIYNQQITKVENFYRILLKLIKIFLCFILILNLKILHMQKFLSKSYNSLLRVGISETICTQKRIINLQKILNTEICNIILFIVNIYNININNVKLCINQYLLYSTLNKSIVTANDIVRDNHKNEINLKFKQWFAGITDGDGYIYVNKDGYVGYEITLSFLDEKVLRILQNKFGGNIKARSGVNAVRYRTQKRDSVIKIIKCLNGLIINDIRLIQLHKACMALNIPIKDPIIPTIDSAYISGLLDSDGCINIYKNNYNDTFRYQLTVSISNKNRSNIDFLINVIGGQIYFDKSKNGYYI
jgi:ubiquinol-cytochrome c reductase cytochrome b subunit